MNSICTQDYYSVEIEHNLIEWDDYNEDFFIFMVNYSDIVCESEQLEYRYLR